MKTAFYEELDSRSLAVVDLIPFWPTYGDREEYWVSRVNVPRAWRGQDVASRLMRQVCQEADDCGVALILAVEPSDGLGVEALTAWYERLGFTGPHWKMRREPQPVS